MVVYIQNMVVSFVYIPPVHFVSSTLSAPAFVTFSSPPSVCFASNAFSVYAKQRKIEIDKKTNKQIGKRKMTKDKRQKTRQKAKETGTMNNLLITFMPRSFLFLFIFSLMSFFLPLHHHLHRHHSLIHFQQFLNKRNVQSFSSSYFDPQSLFLFLIIPLSSICSFSFFFLKLLAVVCLYA